MKWSIKTKRWKWNALIPRLIICCLFVIPVATSCVAQNETVTYIPEETDQILNNPYMGWAPTARVNNYRIPHRLVYAALNWNEVEPDEGNYQFEAFEKTNNFDYWADQDIKIILRFIMDKPKEHPEMDIPKWLYKRINKDGTWYSKDDREGFSPNYNNPILISCHKKLIEELAKRYNHDPRIAFIELGSIGHWGEWHTHYVNDENKPFPRYETAEKYIRPYVDNFTEKFLMLRRPMPIVAQRRFGLYNDMFGKQDDTMEYLRWINKGYIFWLTNEPMPKMPDFWKYAPSGGEFAPSVSIRYLNDEKFDTTVELARLTHITWIGPSCPPARKELKEDIRKNADKLMKIIGYRFVIQQEEHPRETKSGEPMRVWVQWLNKGVAPFYFEWETELALADEKGEIIAVDNTGESVRSLLPGVTEQTLSFRIPRSVKPGEYRLCIGLINPETHQPGIELAINGKRDDGRYPLGKVQIIP